MMQARKGTTAILVLWVAIAILALGDNAVAASSFQVDTTNLQVYRDGLTHVSQSISVDTLASSITIELLSDSVENVLVLDENQMPVDFTVNGSNITILTLGEEQVTLDYDTLALTKKDAETWTLLTDGSYDLLVSLPTNATLLYLNKMPSAINTVGRRNQLNSSFGKLGNKLQSALSHSGNKRKLGCSNRCALTF